MNLRTPTLVGEVRPLFFVEAWSALDGVPIGVQNEYTLIRIELETTPRHCVKFSRDPG